MAAVGVLKVDKILNMWHVRERGVLDNSKVYWPEQLERWSCYQLTWENLQMLKVGEDNQESSFRYVKFKISARYPAGKMTDLLHLWSI